MSLNESISSNQRDLESQEENYMQIKERKILDWTGECSTDKTLNFALSKNDILYVSVPEKLYAVSINHLDFLDNASINGEQGSGDRYTVVDSTPKGELEFGQDYHLMLLYDS